MKKIICLMLVLMLCAASTVTAFASETNVHFVYDNADLLTDYEENVIEQQLSQISQKYQAQVVIMTIDFLDGHTVDSYLESTYDTQGFGYGEKNDGVLLLVCMETSEWRILSNGFAGEAIDSDAIEEIGDAFTSDLSDGNYEKSFKAFAKECEYYLNGYLNGFPFEFGKALLISLVLGVLVAFCITRSWKKQLKSVRKQSKANAYVKDGSMNITQSGDYFMYRNLTKTERQKSNSSSGGGSSRSTGGGSF